MSDIESDDDEVEAVPKDKTKRVQELKAELRELESDGEIEDAEDADVANVEGDIDEAAEEVAQEEPEDVEKESKKAAKEIAKDAKREDGVTFSEAEIDGLAYRVARRAIEIQQELQGGAPSEPAPKPVRTRERDKPPRPTHWSQRRIGGRSK